MEDDKIFIHIPKTGGTTVISSMEDIYWTPEIGFNYRHILKGKRTSNAGDIFKEENFDKYSAYHIFMMLRDPVDRVLSEYYYFKERSQFMGLLSKQPESLEHYVKMPQTHDYMLNFLLGRRIFSTNRATPEELERVIKAIDELPIHVGIFEHFQASLGFFSEMLGIEWSKKIEAKRMTLNRPSVDEVPSATKELIREQNALDQKLYDHCLKKFEPYAKKYSNYKVKFELDKYNHIFPYMSKTNLFQFNLKNRYFMDRNFDFFKALTFFLIKTRNITDGRTLVNSWNKSFLNAVKSNFDDTEFYDHLQKSNSITGEPLDQLMNISNGIDSFFEEDPKGRKKFYEPMTFNLSDVEIKKSSVGLLSRLFGK